MILLIIEWLSRWTLTESVNKILECAGDVKTTWDGTEFQLFTECVRVFFSFFPHFGKVRKGMMNLTILLLITYLAQSSEITRNSKTLLSIRIEMFLGKKRRKPLMDFSIRWSGKPREVCADKCTELYGIFITWETTLHFNSQSKDACKLRLWTWPQPNFLLIKNTAAVILHKRTLNEPHSSSVLSNSKR